MWPLPNLWLGVSVENRRFVWRADLLRETPAAVRFISAEPLLGPLVRATPMKGTSRVERSGRAWCNRCGKPMMRDQWQCANAECHADSWPDGHRAPELDLEGIGWLIVGGESGKGHRPIRKEWVRDLRDAAENSGTAFFLKQWGGATPKANGKELDGRTYLEMPTTKETA